MEMVYYKVGEYTAATVELLDQLSNGVRHVRNTICACVPGGFREHRSA